MAQEINKSLSGINEVTKETSATISTGVSPVVATAMPYRWVALALCLFGYAVAYMQRLGLGPLAPFMKTELALTNAQVGFYTSAAMSGYAIFLIPGGYLVDRFGSRWSLCFGQVVAGIFLISMHFAQTYIMGIVAMFAAGLGLGFIVPASSKGIVEWFALKQRAMAMGIKQTGVNIGGLLTAITLPMIAITFGWRMGFVTLGVVAIVSGIAAAIIYRDPPKDKSETPAKDASCASVSPPVKKEKESWLSVFKTRDIWLLCAAGIALYVAEMGVMAYFVLYLKTHLLIPVVTAGFLLGAIDVGGFFGKPIAGVISDRLLGGKRKPAFIMMGTISTILTVVFAILPIGSPQWLILVCAVIFGFAAVGWGGLHFTMVSECAGKEHAATVLAASLVILAFANVVGVPLFGHISDMTGTWTWSWIYLVILGVIGMTCLFFVREERRRLAT